MIKEREEVSHGYLVRNQAKITIEPSKRQTIGHYHYSINHYKKNLISKSANTLLELEIPKLENIFLL